MALPAIISIACSPKASNGSRRRARRWRRQAPAWPARVGASFFSDSIALRSPEEIEASAAQALEAIREAMKEAREAAEARPDAAASAAAFAKAKAAGEAFDREHAVRKARDKSG